MKAKKEAIVKQIIYSGFLAILGMIVSVDRAIAQVQNPSDTFKTFTDWCLNQNDLTPEARHTVQVLLEQAEIQECDRATEILTQKKELNLSENKIVDVTPLANLQNLRELGLGGNDLKIPTCPIQPDTVCIFE
ncbi:leucine-rich repeat domain-containing protein [Oscillatoria salina]|uniref:leucine-rich repeat domain-containing protein n=1 Tax=Oscillatoria salina TaxID=331517 RepID=UPI001CC9B492|nr:leucine-rich repeat domain-containing protein [Oscillatoria salina]MBZ8182601.1 leucine-rich repeat domain-containing protein [Oscillatoria salina IIICB1]